MGHLRHVVFPDFLLATTLETNKNAPLRPANLILSGEILHPKRKKFVPL